MLVLLFVLETMAAGKTNYSFWLFSFVSVTVIIVTVCYIVVSYLLYRMGSRTKWHNADEYGIRIL